MIEFEVESARYLIISIHAVYLLKNNKAHKPVSLGIKLYFLPQCTTPKKIHRISIESTRVFETYNTT